MEILSANKFIETFQSRIKTAWWGSELRPVARIFEGVVSLSVETLFVALGYVWNDAGLLGDQKCGRLQTFKRFQFSISIHKTTCC